MIKTYQVILLILGIFAFAGISVWFEHRAKEKIRKAIRSNKGQSESKIP